MKVMHEHQDLVRPADRHARQQIGVNLVLPMRLAGYRPFVDRKRPVPFPFVFCVFG